MGQRLEDVVQFVYAIHSVEPKVFSELRALGAGATRRDIDEWLARHHLDGGALDPVEMLMEARSGFVGDMPDLAGDAPRHDWMMPPLVWEPDTGETREEFLKRANAEANAYADRVEEWARAHGIRTGRGSERNRFVAAGSLRWELLARHLIHGEPYEQLAERIRRRHRRIGDRLTPAAIGKHVREAAEKLKIALR
jgi:hypothetical protein